MKCSSNSGFTLVEILVVLVILSMAGALIFVNVGKSMANKQGKAFGREMISLCKKARRKAVDNGMISGLYISSAERRCWVSGEKRSLEYPGQMLVEGEGVQQLNEDLYVVRFYPDGSSSGGDLTLSIGGKTICAFRVDMLTGLVTRTEEHA